MKTIVQSGIVLLLATGFILSSGQREFDLPDTESVDPPNTMTRNTSSPGLKTLDPSVALATRIQSALGLPTGTVTGVARRNSSHLLKVIPPPLEGSRIVFARKEGTLIFQGNSTLNLLCGRCTTTLAEGVVSGQLTDIVLHCNHCGSFNDTEDCAEFSNQ